MTKPKMSALVASAIRNLRDIRGSTSKEILNYIKSQYNNTSDSNIQKQIYTALKRGLDYGILKRDRGFYSLNMDPDMLYKAQTGAPLEQARRVRRRRRITRRRIRRGRDGRRRDGRRRDGRRRDGRRRRRRRDGRRRDGRRRDGRRRRRRTRRRSRSPPRRIRSLTTTCNKCSSRKRTEDTLRKTPIESLRKDTYLYNKNTDNKTPSRQQSRSPDRSQTRSQSSSSDKEMIDDRNQP